MSALVFEKDITLKAILAELKQKVQLHEAKYDVKNEGGVVIVTNRESKEELTRTDMNSEIFVARRKRLKKLQEESLAVNSTDRKRKFHGITFNAVKRE